MDNNIIVDGITLPPPAKDGLSLKPEPIWSDNAGRVSNCAFVGDIRAVMWNIDITWQDLTYEQVKLIRKAFTSAAKPFFNMTFTTDEGERLTIRCYSTMPSSTIRTYRDERGQITGMTVSVVQKE